MRTYYQLVWFIVVLGATSVANANTLISAEQVSKQCLNSTWDQAALVRLKDDQFTLEDHQEKQKVALQLVSCLASPDPVLRDQVAFTGLSQWLRANSFSADVYLSMFNGLSNVLANEVIDEHGVYQPFAALMLAEVARVDRKTPYLNTQQRQYLVDVGVTYLTELSDYRGFEPQIGWRHGVAHSADLLLQLALNPKLDKQQLDQLLTAIASQINAKDQHFYIFGEPGRLAMPVLYVFLRNYHSVEQWQAWLSVISSPKPFVNWAEVYQSQQGLAKLHNTRSFLYAVYAMIKSSSNETLVNMVPALEQAIQSLS